MTKHIIKPVIFYQRLSFVVLFIVLMVFVSHVSAQTSVGIITNLEGNVSIISGVKRAADFGDDIMFKNKIKTGSNSSLVLTYYSGCRQEWFGENTVLEIGQDYSKLISGKLLKSGTFDCELPEAVLSEKDSFKKAAFHFRGVTTVKTAVNEQPVQVMKNDKSKSRRLNTTASHKDDINIRIWTAKRDDAYYRSGEHIIIYLIADKDAYLKLDYFQADGNVVHLIPNIFEEKEKINAGQIYVVGGNKSKLKLIVETPYGKESIRALVSSSPLDEGGYKSIEIIEKSGAYQQRIKQVMAENKHAKIAEYGLDIWSIP